MSDIQFDQDPSQYSTPSQSFDAANESGLKGLLRKIGIVKTGEQAQYILIAIIILCTFGSIMVVVRSNRRAPNASTIPVPNAIFKPAGPARS